MLSSTLKTLSPVFLHSVILKRCTAEAERIDLIKHAFVSPHMINILSWQQKDLLIVRTYAALYIITNFRQFINIKFTLYLRHFLCIFHKSNNYKLSHFVLKRRESVSYRLLLLFDPTFCSPSHHAAKRSE